MAKGICGRCYDEDIEVFPANCEEKPEELAGAPIGQYHCPDCGAMVMAGMRHFPMCQPCLDRSHPLLDSTGSEKLVLPSRFCSRCDAPLDVADTVCHACGLECTTKEQGDAKKR